MSGSLIKRGRTDHSHREGVLVLCWCLRRCGLLGLVRLREMDPPTSPTLVDRSSALRLRSCCFKHRRRWPVAAVVCMGACRLVFVLFFLTLACAAWLGSASASCVLLTSMAPNGTKGERAWKSIWFLVCIQWPHSRRCSRSRAPPRWTNGTINVLPLNLPSQLATTLFHGC